MATQNFRSALGGFNREDVVHYIEFMNTKHVNQVNHLKEENQSLQRELDRANALAQEAAQLPGLREELENTKAQLSTLQAEREAWEAQRIQEQEQLQQLKQQLEQAAKDNAARVLAEQELEAYRRAERAERLAKERAEQIYRQATGTLAHATAQVDEASQQFRDITEQINSQMLQLQAAVETSRNALRDAADTMYTIHPTAE